MKISTVSVYTTFPDKQSAKKVAELCIKKRLAACANIFSSVDSIYRWNEKIQHDREVVIIFKTANYKGLETFLKKNHPYAVPCIVAWKIAKGSPDYLAWIRQENKKLPFD